MVVRPWHHAPVYALGWLLAESSQRIPVRRALEGQSPQTSQQILDALDATACAWNREPTPFSWGGKRTARRTRSRQRRHALGASGVWAARPMRRRHTPFDKWHLSRQPTH